MDGIVIMRLICMFVDRISCIRGSVLRKSFLHLCGLYLQSSPRVNGRLVHGHCVMLPTQPLGAMTWESSY